MRLYERHNFDDGQILLNRILFAFALAIKLILKAVVYSPLLVAGWFITNQILDVQTNKVIWFVIILLFAVIFYFIIYFSKGVLIVLKHNGNLFWVLLFISLTMFTCILPVWIIFDPLQNLIAAYTNGNHEILTCVLAMLFALYIYSRYQFLTNIAPAVAFPYYQRGINFTMHILNLANSFKAKKSQEIF